MADSQEQEKCLKKYMSKAELCELLGISSRTLEQYVSDGIISREKRGTRVVFNTELAIRQYIKRLSDRAQGKTRIEAEAKLKEQKLKADIALKESQGELHKLRTEIAAGRYVSVEEAKLDYSRFFVTFKKFALNLPNRLAGRLTGFVDPVEVRRLENELQTDIERLLKEFVVKAVVEGENAPAKFPTLKPEQEKKKMGRPKKGTSKSGKEI